MFKLLVDELDLSNEEASMLMSVAGNLKVCQVVNPLKTARFEIQKNVLRNYDYDL